MQIQISKELVLEYKEIWAAGCIGKVITDITNHRPDFKGFEATAAPDKRDYSVRFYWHDDDKNDDGVIDFILNPEEMFKFIVCLMNCFDKEKVFSWNTARKQFKQRGWGEAPRVDFNNSYKDPRAAKITAYEKRFGEARLSYREINY